MAEEEEKEDGWDDGPGQQWLLQQRINVSTAANARASRTARPVDATYKREWRRFQEFVTLKRNDHVIPQGPKYLTRQNVDLYFSEVIAHRVCVSDSARRVVAALQAFANRLEHVQQPFIVDSPTVGVALRAQKDRYAARVALKNLDPHDQLPTDVLAEEDYERLHSIILARHDWADLQQSTATCDATYIRNSSFRALGLGCLKFDRAHAPNVNRCAGNSGILTYVLMPGYDHKDKYSSRKVVGGFRHKNYKRCHTGSMAMNLMVRFRNSLPDMNFYRGPLNDEGERLRAAWIGIKIVQKWKSYSAAYSAYKRVYSEAEISWAKVTHFRKSGMDSGGSEGIGTDAVASMSKHNTQKVTRYVSQLDRRVMHVMSGFRVGETRYVGREFLVPPWTMEEMLFAVFPRIVQWRAEYTSANGDESKAAKNWLYQLLPFLALVAIQDGIYWIRDYPNNDASIMLKNTFPNYEAWAAQARQQVRGRENTLIESRADMLNGAAQAAFHVVTRRLDALHDQIVDTRTSLNERMDTFQQSELMREEIPMPRPANLSVRASAIAVPANALANLRASPRIPDFPKNLPSSMRALLVEHTQHDLASFENAIKSSWPPKRRNAYSRRQYLFKQIQARSRNFATLQTEEARMEVAADRMDEERGNKTVTQFYEQLKRLDPTTKRRRKRNAPGADA